MKRLLAVLFLLVFTSGLVACSDETTDYTLLGKWKAPVSVVGLDSEESSDAYMILEFMDNGEGKITNVQLDEGHFDKFNYTYDDASFTVTTEDGNTVDCTYEIVGDKLTISTGYKTAEYTRLSE